MEIKNSEFFTIEGFIAIGNISGSDLIAIYGFTEQEVTASSIATSHPAPTSGPYQPPHAQIITLCEEWKMSTDDLKVTYQRVDAATAKTLLANPHPNNKIKVSSHHYSGTGHHCPRCGRLFVLIEEYKHSDDMCADEKGTWTCDDSECGMKKEEIYTGYGTVF